MIFLVIDEIKAFINNTSKISPIYGIISKDTYNLWFICMLAGLYFFTPFIIKIKNVISSRTYTILAIIMMVWAVGSQAYSTEKLPYTIGVVVAFLAYYLLGDVIINVVNVRYKPYIYFVISIVMFLLTFVIRYMGVTYWMFHPYISFFSPTITIASICIFIGFKQMHIRKDFSSLAGKTYYIYIFHTIIYNAVFSIVDYIGLVGVSELIMIFLVTVITFVIAFVFAVVYNKFWMARGDWKKRWYEMKIWSIISSL